MNKNIIDH